MLLKRLEYYNTKENLWLYIFRLLKERPMHAYLLREEINKRFGFMPGTMTAYKILYSLKRKGYVSVENDGRKKVYTITDKGRDSLDSAIGFYRERVRMLS